jgi:ribosomal protein S18 acetylase RimI-like enzyme
MRRDRRAGEGVRFEWRAEVADDELVILTESYGGASEAGWWNRIRSHSLGWVTARVDGGTLVGFVNVAWDGGDHAFLIDTKVHSDHQRRGIGTELVRIAARHAKDAGCEWLEVDFDEHLASFYYDACGFTPALAGLLHLPTNEECLDPIPMETRGQPNDELE